MRFVKTNGTAARNLEQQIRKLKTDMLTKSKELTQLKENHKISMARVQSDHTKIVSTLRSDINKLTTGVNKSSNGKSKGSKKQQTLSDEI